MDRLRPGLTALIINTFRTCFVLLALCASGAQAATQGEPGISSQATLDITLHIIDAEASPHLSVPSSCPAHTLIDNTATDAMRILANLESLGCKALAGGFEHDVQSLSESMLRLRFVPL